MPRFTHCVLYFCETKHFSVLDRRTINEKVSIGKKVFIEFPVRKEPFEAIIKSICESKDEAEKKAKMFRDGGDDLNGTEILQDEENRSCSWSPEPPPIKEEQNDPKDKRINNGNNNNNNNYVTSDLFCDVMNRVVEVLQGIQNNSDKNLKECIKEMTKINQNLSGTNNGTQENEEIDEEGSSSQDKEDDAAMLVTTASQTSAVSTATAMPKPEQKSQKSAATPATKIAISQQQSKIITARPQTNIATHGNARIIASSGWRPPPPPPPPMPPQAMMMEDDHSGPTWEFVSREKVDEVFEDCENYKIFARKISYAIFDPEEQKLKMNERNKKKVSELRKIIKLKYPSERREFDDMIWRNCKNAVNNTTYNEAKRRKRHSALMLGSTEATAQNFLSSNYEAIDTTPPSKKPYDIPGQQESTSIYFKAEPRSELDS
uniref:BEN domain-containing protein n=1 Tax=Panagrolaimus sp. ES5 TaxID=591445 RepID=A0AC34FAJ4_9BILA